MKTLAIELRKEKRTGVIPVLLAVGVLGAAYAFVNFIMRKDTLLNLPLAPMDVLLTQLYGMIMVLNLFGIVVATCMIYNMEFKGSAVKKMYMLPVSVPAMYLCKFLILTVMFLVAIVLQNLALAQIGMTDLPDGAFEMGTLVRFAGYSFLTSMPVLSFMLLISSRFENMWVPLGIGVAGFLSGMALANSGLTLLLVHPFVIILKPAVAMSAQPDSTVALVALVETLLFLAVGLCFFCDGRKKGVLISRLRLARKCCAQICFGFCACIFVHDPVSFFKNSCCHIIPCLTKTILSHSYQFCE